MRESRHRIEEDARISRLITLVYYNCKKSLSVYYNSQPVRSMPSAVHRRCENLHVRLVASDSRKSSESRLRPAGDEITIGQAWGLQGRPTLGAAARSHARGRGGVPARLGPGPPSAQPWTRFGSGAKLPPPPRPQEGAETAGDFGVLHPSHLQRHRGVGAARSRARPRRLWLRAGDCLKETPAQLPMRRALTPRSWCLGR
jgi:hypothetical protein